MSTNDPEETTDYSEEELKKLLAAEVLEGLNPLPCFKFVVLKYNYTLYRTARSKINQHESAEEVIQTAFFKAHNALKSYSQERILGLRLRAWLNKITDNEAKRYLNKHGPRQSRETSLNVMASTNQDATLHLYDDDLDILVGRKEKYTDFRRAFRQLSGKAQSALYLHFVQGLNYKEIGLVLNLAEGSIKAIISRARKTLRDTLGEYFDEHGDLKGE